MQRDPLDIDRLGAALSARWARVDVVEQTTSTNADLLADHAAPDRSVLVAEHQTAGRGRLERAWASPPRAGLTFSALLRPGVPLASWGWLPLLVGVALHEALVDVDTALKWPNDLLCRASEGKLAGILAQTAGDAVVVGIGLNVSLQQDELPVPTASSLALCGGTDLDRTGLLIAILERLDARVAQWADVGGDAVACGLAAAYREVCLTVGRQVAVTTTDGTPLVGTAEAIDGDGRVVLDIGGALVPVGAGDVEHLRPA